MNDYIQLIAEKIQQKCEVIFYTVGSGTFEHIRELEHRFGLLPTSVCDGDSKKQGRTYKGLEGITVISPGEALLRFPKGYFFISSLDYRYQIIGYLTEVCGVEPARIINYVPVKRINSCSFIQKALIYDQTGDLRFCWRTPCPAVASNKTLKVNELAQLRGQLIETIKNGEVPAHEACVGCPQLSEEFYPEEPRAWSINYFCQSVCNYRCSYCTVAHYEKPSYDAGRHTLGEVIGAYKSEDILSPDYSVILSTAGEPLLHPKRKEFYQSFDGAELVINTNGSIYDADLVELMNEKKVLLLISVDAGTDETYAKVKGVDAFNKVKNNLSAYSKASVGIVALKYLFVPGVNDNPEDVDGFIRFCEDVDAMFVVVSVDYYSVGNVTEQTKEMIGRLSQGLSERNILCVPYTAWETAEYAGKMRELMK